MTFSLPDPEDQNILCGARDTLLPGLIIVKAPWETDILVDYTDRKLVVMAFNMESRVKNKEDITLDSIKDGSYKAQFCPILTRLTDEE